MKKLICSLALTLSFQSTPILASQECVDVAKIAGMVMAARHKGVTKSELISILKSEPLAMEMIDQVFLVKQANDDQDLLSYIQTYMQIWYEECVKLNKEIDSYSHS